MNQCVYKLMIIPLVYGNITMVLPAPGLPQMVDGLALMAQLLADSTLMRIMISLEPGGMMQTTKEELGQLQISILISKLPRSRIISLLAPGSLQMVVV